MPKCLRCGLEWNSFKERPKVCPQCKSYRWDIPAQPIGRPKTKTEDKPKSINMGKYLREQKENKPKMGRPRKKK